MAEGQTGATRPWLWMELFRTFQVALDPKKLVLAAGGLLVAAAGTCFVSWIFFSMKSEPLLKNYTTENYIKGGDSEEIARRKADDAYANDRAAYDFAKSLAGPKDESGNHGMFRVFPWHENRGANPYLLIAGQTHHGTGVAAVWEWIKHDGVRVMLEPLRKFMSPIRSMLNPHADFSTRIYLLFIALVMLATWAFFGGAITRIAVMQFAGKDTPSMMDALRFVGQKYVHYVAAPLVPVLFVAGIVLITVLTFGLINLIPYLGDLVDGVLWPIVLLLAFAQALLLIGLVGYPLMFATISAEGSDSFDALSRSYNYVYQAPWHYLWNAAVAIVYGMALVFFVVFMGSMVVYLSKWAMAQTPGSEHFSSRRADHLFMYAPTTFGWRDLLVDRPELKTTATEQERNTYMEKTLGGGNYLSARLVQLWTILMVLFVIGYGYSYFFSASTMIYLLMRFKIDDTELDEVFAEEESPDEPMVPPTTLPGPGAAPQTQMVDAPTLRPPADKPE
jgi:hypothetical protein